MLLPSRSHLPNQRMCCLNAPSPLQTLLSLAYTRIRNSCQTLYRCNSKQFKTIIPPLCFAYQMSVTFWLCLSFGKTSLLQHIAALPCLMGGFFLSLFSCNAPQTETSNTSFIPLSQYLERFSPTNRAINIFFYPNDS